MLGVWIGVVVILAPFIRALLGTAVDSFLDGNVNVCAVAATDVEFGTTVSAGKFRI